MARLTMTLALTMPLAGGGCQADEEASGASPEAAAGGAPSEETPPPGLPTIDPSEGFTIDQGDFTVPPRAEGIYCVRIPIPEAWQGRDIALLGIDADLPDYTHHYFMSYSPNPLEADGPMPCEGETGFVEVVSEGLGHPDGKLLFGAGTGLTTGIGVPEGYGRLMVAGGHLITSHHVLNFTDETLQMHGRFNLRVTEAAEIPHLVNVLNCVNRDVTIAPTSDVSITGTCTLPFDLDLVMLSSHAHQYLQRFELRLVRDGVVDTDPVYVSTDWDSPLLQYLETPIVMKKGDALQFTCHYSNPTDEEIVYGLGVYNEMCATMNLYALPASVLHGDPPTLGGVVLRRDVPAPLVDTTDLPTSF